MNKCTCADCGWRGTYGTALHAPNPFEPEEIITGCPDCKAVDTMRTACYSDMCWQDASYGATFPDGVYRWSCFNHSTMAKSPAVRALKDEA